MSSHRQPAKGFFTLKGQRSRPQQVEFIKPPEKILTTQLTTWKPCKSTMRKLQGFAYNPNTDAPPSQAPSKEQLLPNPSTPMPQRIPLSDLISNTPKTMEETTDVSPDDKVVWKISPRKTPVPFVPQESPRTNVTELLTFLKEDDKVTSTPTVGTKSQSALRYTSRENSSPSTPLVQKSRPLPGPSPLNLKRSASFTNGSSFADRPRKRRIRSSDIVFQKRMSTLLEQAQSIYKGDNDEKFSQPSDDYLNYGNFSDSELGSNGDLGLLEKELPFDHLSSDGIGMEMLNIVQPVLSSDDLFDNDFDSFDLEELEALESSSKESSMSAQQTTQESVGDEDDVLFGYGYDELMNLDFDSQSKEETKPISKRFQVISVEDMTYLHEGKSGFQKTLQLREDKSNEQYILHLRGDWITSPIEANDVVNVISVFFNRTCIVDNSTGFLILHPDYLTSSTHVADSFKCLRRAVLQDQIKATCENSKPLVYGSIIHELFQQAISVMDFSTPHLESIIDSLVIRHIEQLYSINITPAEATAELREKIYLLQSWAEVFVAPQPSIYSFMADHCGSSDAKPKVSINKVLDIEEHIWSPMYGIKGNIDATVQVRIEEPGVKPRTLIVPLEVKTGKNTSIVNHRAQTMLYTLLMSDRYDIDVECGMLYYVDAKESIRVRVPRNEVRGLIMGRNELAKWIKSKDGLPRMLKSPRDCKNCYAMDSCLVYHKTLENGTGESSGLGPWFDEQTNHLEARDAEFLNHWVTLLNKEEADIFRFRNELWTMLSEDREKVGRCFGNLVIDPQGTSIDRDGEKINRFRYCFHRAESPSNSTQSRQSFLHSQISIGDPIVVSDEDGHFALANGFVTDLQPDVIYVNVDRKLHGARTRQPGFDAIDYQDFTGIVEMLEDGVPRISQVGTQINSAVTYRVDKDEFKSGMAMARNNIIQLFTKGGDTKRRELIVHGREPVFKHSLQGTQYPNFENQQDGLNVDQRKAVEKILTAEDYALVLGMPGTGKTTTIAHIIRALVGSGKSVLLTSYTHTAVDNILLKLRNEGIKMLRLGSLTKIHPEVREFAVCGSLQASTLDELHEKYTSPLIVATTCLGINHFIFNKRKFDYCIVDEASQLTLPACLGPLRYADRFVLVGDHYQLPPLVRNVEAQRGGLDVSLFRLLSERHPRGLTILEHQYRMNEDIMLLSNALVYDGMLKCGNENVAKRVLQIPDRKQLESAKPWVREVLSDRYKVVFCDTDRLPAQETRRGDRTTNEVEAALIKQTVDALHKGGVPSSSIGVMSVYRSQLKLLNHLLTPDHPGVEIHTADRFQGRDKEVVIISLVRSNVENYVGELLQDWRRVNVAFTRAKSKLIIFGSRSTIRETKPLDEFVKLVEAKGWVYQIPRETAIRESPRKEVKAKENIAPYGDVKRSGGKTLKVTGSTVLKRRPVLRDIVNEHR